MAHASNKITDFPGRPDAPSSIAPIPEGLLTEDQDPTGKIRDLIEQLQEAAHEARIHRRAAEGECDRLRLELEANTKRAKPAPAGEPNVKALIKERDMLIEQQSQYGPVISELKQKLKTLETDHLEALRGREEAERAHKLALHQSDSALHAGEEARARKDEAVRQRDAAIRQRDQAKEEKEAALAKVEDAKKALAQARSESASGKQGDPSFEKQLLSVRQARDAMAAQVTELTRKVAELEDHAAELAYCLEATGKEASQAQVRQAQLEDALRTAEAAGAAATRAAPATGNEEQLKAELEDLRCKLDAVIKEREANDQAVEASRTSLNAAKKQIDAIIRDRDTIKQQFSESAIAMEAELNGQIAEVARLRQQLGSTEAKLSQSDERTAQFDKRRLEIIELHTQLENAHREIRLLSASLAETRLQAKMVARKAASGISKGNGQARAPVAPASAEPPGKSTVAAMRRCFQTFSRDQKQLSELKELEGHASQLAGTARDNGLPVLHRVTVALATLLGDFYDTPDQLSPEALTLINQTIEFIGALLDNSEAEQRVKLGEARVYVVDDDQNTCDTVVDALNIVGLQTQYSLYSSTAVAELAGNYYDLIILDINLPELDGFELCSHIRNMALHAETPVFFISGHASLENRVKASLCGGHEFIAKPFNVQELALRSLKSVISSQLHSASR